LAGFGVDLLVKDRILNFDQMLILKVISKLRGYENIDLSSSITYVYCSIKTINDNQKLGLKLNHIHVQIHIQEKAASSIQITWDS
jgi:hypothetical protein